MEGKPLLENFAGKQYVHSHKDRVDAFFRSEKGIALQKRFGMRIPANVANEITLRVSPMLWAVELKYPGDDYDLIVEKWIYVIRKGQFVLEGWGKFHQETSIYSAIFRHQPVFKEGPFEGDPPAPGQDGFIEMPLDSNELLQGLIGVPIPAEPGDKPSDFRVFLTPWRLNSATAAAMLGDAAKLAEATVPARGGIGAGLFTAVIDPSAWAIACNHDFYQGQVEAYETWVNEPERQAKVYVASIFRNWIQADGGKDPLDIADELKAGKSGPDTFLKQFEKEEIKAREPKDHAGAYLCATCLDSAEFKFMKQAMMDGGPHGMGALSMTMAAAALGLNQCAVGRAWQLKEVEDNASFYRKQIVHDGAPYVSWDNFANHRWLWYSSWINFGDIVGAYMTMKAKQNALTLPEADRIAKLMKEMGVDIVEDLDAKNRKAYKYLKKESARGKQMSDLVTRKQFKAVSANLVSMADKRVRIDADAGGFLKVESSELPLLDTKAGKFLRLNGARHMLEAFDKIHGVAKFPIDILNVVFAFEGLRKSDPGQRIDKAASLLGACADMSTLVLEAAGPKLIARWGWRKASLRGVGGALGFVSGAMDMYDMAGQAGTAYMRGTTGELVGAGIGVVGGATVALGGAIVAVSMFAPGLFAASSWAGPFGWAAAAIGTALLFIGSLMIFLFKLTPYEEMAHYSFLGKTNRTDYPNLETRYPDWAFAGMPSIKAANDAMNLTTLLTNYSMKVIGSTSQRMNEAFQSTATLEIVVGLLDHEAEIEVIVEQSYTGVNYSCKLLFQQNTDQFKTETTFSPGSLLLQFDKVDTRRREDNSLEALLIPLRPMGLWDRQDKPMTLFETIQGSRPLSQATAKVKITSKQYYGDPMLKYFQIDTTSEDPVSSLNHANLAK